MLPEIISEYVKYYYGRNHFDISKSLSNITSKVKDENRLKLNDVDLYIVKLEDFLFNSALGMVPSKKWDGGWDADGGMIVVKNDGELLCLYALKRATKKELVKYLFDNTYFETSSTSRHCYGKIYKDSTKMRLKLNLQIRMK